MAEKKTPATTPDDSAHEPEAPPPPGPAAPATPTARYRVLIAGISRPGLAPAYQGEIVDGATLGDAKRIQKLLDLKRIEVADD